MQVRDNGCGIPEKIREQIFDPFFTTKPIGKGTGMGLAMVHGIVQHHQGTIQVESTPGQGTTFEVRLPTCQSCPIEALPIENEMPAGKERILIVDDERAILNAWQELLTDLGYEITTFQEPVRVLEALERENITWDLLITDQNMPGMNGAELALKLRQSVPNLPVIICTGYSELCTREDARHLEFEYYLQKPCNAQELALAVRQVLDQSLQKLNATQPHARSGTAPGL